MSKGDTYRPVNRNKYDQNYLRIFGIKCPVCGGSGCVLNRYGMKTHNLCNVCEGKGYIERKSK